MQVNDLEALAAEQAAQRTLLTFLARGLMMIAERRGLSRQAITSVWETRAPDMIAGADLGNVPADRQAAVRDDAVARFKAMVTAAAAREG
jgi:hypothetical protein